VFPASGVPALDEEPAQAQHDGGDQREDRPAHERTDGVRGDAPLAAEGLAAQIDKVKARLLLVSPEVWAGKLEGVRGQIAPGFEADMVLVGPTEGEAGIQLAPWW